MLKSSSVTFSALSMIALHEVGHYVGLRGRKFTVRASLLSFELIPEEPPPLEAVVLGIVMPTPVGLAMYAVTGDISHVALWLAVVGFGLLDYLRVEGARRG
ncbi:hypothetical protein IG193_01110 [Infirmifilum lucidum]|uniref:Peptidase M50 domain-containing protein n=1 Tax=Infirmifilum lucidum TaxID=2776706 RepID=A0A7L9FJN4_9CREN|nr:hypothetical protein [Infirmifilum lucidum]QOJ79096.1 hypothetical protein IG193_01110 [Infirmifilum lucidum]